MGANIWQPGTALPPTSSADKYLAGDYSFRDLNKAAVGLENVDNTADADKPVSTAVAAALASKTGLGKNKFTGIQVFSNEQIVAASGALDLTTVSTNLVVISGSAVSISSIPMDRGAVVFAYVDDTVTFVHSSTLRVAGAADYSAGPDQLVILIRHNGYTLVAPVVIDLRKATLSEVLAGINDTAYVTSQKLRQSTGRKLLATVATTSGTSITETLDLTPYSMVELAINDVSFTAGVDLTLNGLSISATAGAASSKLRGLIRIDLDTSLFVGTTQSVASTTTTGSAAGSTLAGKLDITDAADQDFLFSGGTFDAGEILIYGIFKTLE